MPVLKLTQQGYPAGWISPEAAATMIVKNMVNWSLGDNMMLLHGGKSNTGITSTLAIPEIIAVKGQGHFYKAPPALLNRYLFRRDDHQCLYCGKYFDRSQLTRDHVIPKGKGGENLWTNVVAACKRCNNFKGCRTPEEAGMELRAIPFTPNAFEFMYLASHNIKSEQMNYLSGRFTENRRWAL